MTAKDKDLLAYVFLLAFRDRRALTDGYGVLLPEAVADLKDIEALRVRLKLPRLYDIDERERLPAS